MLFHFCLFIWHRVLNNPLLCVPYAQLWLERWALWRYVEREQRARAGDRSWWRLTADLGHSQPARAYPSAEGAHSRGEMLDLVTCLGSLHDVALLHGVCQYDPSELFIYLFFWQEKEKNSSSVLAGGGANLRARKIYRRNQPDFSHSTIVTIFLMFEIAIIGWWTVLNITKYTVKMIFKRHRWRSGRFAVRLGEIKRNSSFYCYSLKRSRASQSRGRTFHCLFPYILLVDIQIFDVFSWCVVKFKDTAWVSETSVRSKKWCWSVTLCVQVYAVDWSQTRTENLVVSGSWDHTAKVVRNSTNPDLKFRQFFEKTIIFSSPVYTSALTTTPVFSIPRKPRLFGRFSLKTPG